MSVEVESSAARVRNSRATRSATFMSEEFFVARGARAAVFVRVAERPALPVLSLVQVDDIVAADVADGLGKRRLTLFLRIRRPVRAEGYDPECVWRGPFSFREHVNVGNRMRPQLVPLGGRRDVLLQRLVETGLVESREQVRDLLVGRVRRYAH